MADTIHTDIDDFDDFDTPQTVSAPQPVAATERAVRAHTGPVMRAGGEITDDGVQFGADPDFVVEANRRSGATFDIPAANDILDVRRQQRTRGRGGRGAVNPDDTAQPADDVSADRGSETGGEAGPLSREQRRQQKQADRERRKAEREQRVQDRRAERDRQRETAASAKADARERAPHRQRPRRALLAGASAAALAAAVGVGGYLFLHKSSDTPADVPPQTTTAAAQPKAAQFAAGDACRPGNADGATVLDSTSSTDRSTPQSTISALEHAYYAQRSGSAVAAVWAKNTAGVNAAAIQKGIDQHFANRQSAYCVQVTPTSKPDTFTVQTIESDGVHEQRGKQEVTVRNNNGTYEIVGLRNLAS